MPSGRPWTDAEDDTVRQLMADGVPQSEIGRRIDRTRGAVAKRAQALGVRSDRTDTAAATQAKVIDAKARRAALELALLEDAQRLREQIWAPAVVFNFGGKDNTYEERNLPEPPARDKLSLMQAAAQAVDRSLKIAVHDADSGVAEATSLLDAFAEALEKAAAATGLDDTEAMT